MSPTVISRSPLRLIGRGQDVGRLLDHAGHLHGELAGARFQVAGRHELVVAGDDLRDLTGGDVGRLHAHRVDRDLQHLLAAAVQIDLQHARRALQPVLQFARDLEQRPLGRRARQHDADDRVGRGVGLLDDRLLGVGRKLAPR
jgi:hypothetical protein